ncbi:MAG: DUF1559 domain-containing protein [Phycisphaeraceae bacterium]|nr:MAG: DUF1559 domain-containing protein [Phycisphaeraceae bacterium]
MKIGRASASGAPRRVVAGFTLIDVLVSITVIGVLIGLLLPSLSMIHEMTRRTVCRSNVRQIGLGLAMYADQERGFLPPSVFKPEGPGRAPAEPHEMLRLRLSRDMANAKNATSRWDGLGRLHDGGFLLGPKVFYCPSHRGDHHLRDYARRWGDTDITELFGNFQFRGSGPNNQRQLYNIEPSKTALVSDGMRTLRDFNHTIGANVLRADMSSEWVQDDTGAISRLLQSESDSPNSPQDIELTWRLFDLYLGEAR